MLECIRIDYFDYDQINYLTKRLIPLVDLSISKLPGK